MTFELRDTFFTPADPTLGAFRIRVALVAGEPWWIASDVCQALDLGNPTQALTRLDEDEQGTLISNEGGPGRRIVSEPGLYALILGSRKPEAKAFKRWIVHEVLPTIRKTGSYQAPAFEVPGTFHAALLLAAQLEQQRETLARTVTRQAKDLAVLEPKAAFADRVAEAEGCHTIEAAAKILGTGEGRLFTWLRKHEFLIPGTSSPYQRFINAGLFLVKERVFQDIHYKPHLKSRLHITGKGLLEIQKRMRAEDACPLLRPQHQPCGVQP